MKTRETRRRFALVAALAIAAGVVGAWVSPEPWPAGEGILRVNVDGKTVLEEEVTIGSGERLLLEANKVRAELSAGVPNDGAIAVALTFENQSDASFEAVRITLSYAVLTDSSRAIVDAEQVVETIPVLQANPSDGTVTARRTPPKNAAVLLALLAAVVVFWVTEIVDLWITSLAIPVVLVFAGVTGGTAALAPFFHPIIALFFAGFMLAEGMARVGLDHRIAVMLVARLGRTPATLFGAMLVVSAVLSMWMSNTASTALLLPIALAITKPLRAPGYQKALVLGIAYAATIGGTGSAIGTPANPLAIEFLSAYANRDISFIGWFAFGLPMVFLTLPVMGLYLYRRSDVDVDPTDFVEARRLASKERAALGAITPPQRRMIAVLLLIVSGWLTQQFHGVSPGIVGLAGVNVLAALGLVQTADLKNISWSSLLTFGGGLALGRFLVESGTSDWMATRMAHLSVLPSWAGVALVAVATLAMTTVASNTATAAVLVPLAIPLAAMLGVDATMLVVVVAIASSVDFALAIGTPPTMMAHSTGLVDAREIFRLGAPLDLIALAILVTGVVASWQLFGLV